MPFKWDFLIGLFIFSIFHHLAAIPIIRANNSDINRLHAVVYIRLVIIIIFRTYYRLLQGGDLK